jgi:uncharacterized membrane protein YbaN (DUF454 family)
MTNARSPKCPKTLHKAKENTAITNERKKLAILAAVISIVESCFDIKDRSWSRGSKSSPGITNQWRNTGEALEYKG